MEHERLVEKNGEKVTHQMISILDNWYLTKGKKPYKSDYHTMVGTGWVLNRFNEDKYSAEHIMRQHLLSFRVGSMTLRETTSFAEY